MAGKIFGGLFWGMLADKWKCHRLLIIFTCLVSILCLIGQLGAAMALADEKEYSCKFSVKTNSLNATFFNSTTSAATILQTNNYTTPSSAVNNKPPRKEKFGTLFLALLILSVLNLFSDCSLEFLDTGTIRKVQITSMKRKVNYGGQRMFGPFGAVFGNIVTNLSIQYFPTSKVSCFTGMFICYTIFSLFTLVSILLTYRGLSFQEKSKKEDKADDQEKLTKDDEQSGCKAGRLTAFRTVKDEKEKLSGLFKEGVEFEKKLDYRKTFIRTMFRNDIFFLLISTAMSGVFYSPMLSFHYLLLKDLNAAAIMYSLITAFGGIGGIAGFKFSNKIVKIITPFRSLAVCYICIALVHLCFGLANNAWVPVLSRPLFGLSYCLALSSGMTYLKNNCAVDVLTSIISIYVALFNGVGPGIGLAISGEIYGVYGGKTLFCSLAVISFCWSLVVGLYYVHHSNKGARK